MKWTRSETLALAEQKCVHCLGIGLREGRAGKPSPCHCVFRAIFRACHARFEAIARSERGISSISMERFADSGARVGRKATRATYGLKREEYSADFVLTAKRVLGADSVAYGVFKFYFLYGADWRLAAPRLGLNRGEFYHEVYRIESRLGRAFAELRPYPLWPVDEYFALHTHKPERREEPGDVVEIEFARRVGRPIKPRDEKPLKFPLKKFLTAA